MAGSNGFQVTRYHAALLFSGLGSIVLLFALLFSQQIREDLVRAAYHPQVTGRCKWRYKLKPKKYPLGLKQNPKNPILNFGAYTTT